MKKRIVTPRTLLCLLRLCLGFSAAQLAQAARPNGCNARDKFGHVLGAAIVCFFVDCVQILRAIT